tara:strand:+ start:1361 stop:1786 length:426 start_codon:yes stop_codon:yes gene_type:complete
MIKYKLFCKNCDLIFDSWFANSKEYEKLKKKKLINCHDCNSLDVHKTLMAPKLLSRSQKVKSEKKLQNYENFKKKLKEYQKFIKNNFKDVGDNFAYEARSIHYNNKKEKAIYGTASKKDIKELKEEGIEAQMIPWIEDNKN